MKLYTFSKDISKANPTIETQKKIIEVIEKSKNPLSITAIARLSKTGFNETKITISFLNELGIIQTIISSGGTTLVTLKENENG